MTLHVIAGTYASLTLPCTCPHVLMCKRNFSNHRPVALCLQPMDRGASGGPRLFLPAMKGMSVQRMLKPKLWLVQNFELFARCSLANDGRQHPGILLCEGVVPFSLSLPSLRHLGIHCCKQLYAGKNQVAR